MDVTGAVTEGGTGYVTGVVTRDVTEVVIGNETQVITQHVTLHVKLRHKDFADNNNMYIPSLM